MQCADANAAKYSGESSVLARPPTAGDTFGSLEGRGVYVHTALVSLTTDIKSINSVL